MFPCGLGSSGTSADGNVVRPVTFSLSSEARLFNFLREIRVYAIEYVSLKVPVFQACLDVCQFRLVCMISVSRV